MSANDKGDNEIIMGAGHRSPGIYITAEETPGNPQPGDRLMKGLCTDLLAFTLQLRKTPGNLS